MGLPVREGRRAPVVQRQAVRLDQEVPSGAGLVEVQDPTYVIGERAAKWSPSGKFWELASSLDHKEGEEEQDFTETASAIDPQECWERGVPLVPIGVQAKESAERRRIDELVEAIVGPCNWNLAA